jgi:hypothetical protein
MSLRRRDRCVWRATWLRRVTRLWLTLRVTGACDRALEKEMRYVNAHGQPYVWLTHRRVFARAQVLSGPSSRLFCGAPRTMPTRILPTSYTYYYKSQVLLLYTYYSILC